MDIAIVALASFLTALLTFFSGFGLGTILMPVFALFFPVEVAIALTGVVHFANNLFKISLIGKYINSRVLLRFGIPAILASFTGAWLLVRITSLPVIHEYHLWNREFVVTPVKLTVAVLLIVFSLLEIVPALKNIRFGKNLFLGGSLSGFFGGLTGIQGAIRSAFLIKSGLTKEAYIATGAMIACLIDFTRLSVYASRFREARLQEQLLLIIVSIMAALTGTFIGNKLLKKTTFRFVRSLVAIMLFMVALAMGTGMI